MRKHELKIWPTFYDAIVSGEKTFEVRLNDRDFGVGDVLWLREYQPNKAMVTWACYTGHEMERTVTYIMHGGRFGIDPHYCILGLSHD